MESWQYSLLLLWLIWGCLQQSIQLINDVVKCRSVNLIYTRGENDEGHLSSAIL
jgi:hypothetical protein